MLLYRLRGRSFTVELSPSFDCLVQESAKQLFVMSEFLTGEDLLAWRIFVRLRWVERLTTVLKSKSSDKKSFRYITSLWRPSQTLNTVLMIVLPSCTNYLIRIQSFIYIRIVDLLEVNSLHCRWSTMSLVKAHSKVSSRAIYNISKITCKF